MSIESTIKTLLAADATLLATATGGVHSFDSVGRMGINRTNVPSAFDSNGIIKPCVLVRLRNSNPDPALQDDTGQYVATRSIVETWLYQDSGYSTIETMHDRIYALLHAQRVTGLFRCEWAGTIRSQYDYELNASVERADWLCVGKRSV